MAPLAAFTTYADPVTEWKWDIRLWDTKAGQPRKAE